MQTLSGPLMTFFPLILGLAAFVLLAWRCDRIGRRVTPDLVSRPGSQGSWKAPRRIEDWLPYLGRQLFGVAFLIAFIAGPPAVAYVALGILTVALGYYAYTLRIRPLFQRGATRHERFTLLSLMIVWVVASAWFLGRFAGRAHGAV